MTDALNEQLSACLDGELPPGELDLLLKRLGPGAKQSDQAAQLRAAIGRYSLIGEALRAERPAVASRDFASKVMAAVAEESAQPAPAVASRRVKISPAAIRYLRPVAGIAVAAGVAAVAVLSMQPTVQPERAAGPALIAANEPSAAPVAATADSDPSYVVPTSTSSSAFIPGTRLTNYVVAHSEYSSPLGRRSVLTGVLADDDEEAAQEAAQESEREAQQPSEQPQISIHEDGAPER